MIIIKSASEIDKLRESGKIVDYAHKIIEDKIKPGISTLELDEVAEKVILKYGAIPAFKGYGGFPGSICASINEEVVHGIPKIDRVLKDGDIISIDIGAKKNGFYGDAARTHPVGNASEEALRLIEVTKQSFYEGLKFCKLGYRLSDVSNSIQTYIESNNFSVVRDYVGHGVGSSLHEDPQIPNYGPAGRGPRLMTGMVLAIEPMVNAGGFRVKVLGDNWTVVTCDGKYSAHYENTIAITEDEPEILTISV